MQKLVLVLTVTIAILVIVIVQEVQGFSITARVKFLREDNQTGSVIYTLDSPIIIDRTNRTIYMATFTPSGQVEFRYDAKSLVWQGALIYQYPSGGQTEQSATIALKVKNITNTVGVDIVELGGPGSWITIGNFANEMPATGRMLFTNGVSTLQIDSIGKGVGEDMQ